LAGIVKRGNEGFVENQFFYVIHEDIKIVQGFNNVSPLIDQIFQMGDPAIQIGWLSQGLNFDAHLFDVFSELNIHKPEEVLLLGGEGAVDIYVLRLCILQ
jgi:hypothetical protein